MGIVRERLFLAGKDEAGRRSEGEMDAEFDRFHSKADRLSFSVALPSAGISNTVLGKLGRSGRTRLESVVVDSHWHASRVTVCAAEIP